MAEDITLKPHAGPQTEFLSTKADICIFGGSAGGGKALDYDTNVLTPHGWEKVKDLTVGDAILDEKGHSQHIIAEYPQPMKQMYKVITRDGSVIRCCEDHLWPVKAKGSDKLMTTHEIYSDYQLGKKNYTLPLYQPDDSEDFGSSTDLPVDPYILGCLIGDGTFRTSRIVGFTTQDHEHFQEEFFKAGYPLTKWESCKKGYAYGVQNFPVSLVREIGMEGHYSYEKFVPEDYKKSKYENRLSILQGLMDTDGSRESSKNSAEFSTTSEQLAYDVQYLVRSVGGTARVSERVTKYTYKGVKKDGRKSYRIYIRHPDLDKIFRLERKKKEDKGQNKKRNTILSVEKDGEDFSKCFSVSGESKLFVVDGFVVTHNSFALLMDPLRHINIPDFYAIMFRRQAVEIGAPGGLADASKKIYPLLGGEYFTATKTWKFPSGAKIVFKGLDHIDDVEALRGVEISRLYFDELTTFEEIQFWYPQTRLRNTNGVRPATKATTNPQSDGFVKDFISWWIDDEGFAIEERSGVIRYFIRDDEGEILWFYTEKEAYEYAKDVQGLEDEEIAVTAATFIRSSLDDNPSLGPEYKKKLLSMPPKQRAELLGGNWNFDASTGIYFKREWVDEVEPSEIANVKFKKIVRAWDTASSPPSQTNKNPDWTVGLKMGLTEEGYVYILDMVRFRDTIGKVKEEMLRTAHKDGTKVIITVPLDPGGHGKHAFQDHVKNLSGYIVKKAKTEKSKLERFLPFASQAEHGWVKIVKADWNNALFQEFEGFVGDGKKKDDIVDAASDSYKELNTGGTLLPEDLSIDPNLYTQDSVWQ